MQHRTLTLIRNACFSLLGLVLFSYSISVLVMGNPAPVSPLIPALSGVVTAIIVGLAALVAGRHSSAIAWDEMARYEWHKCLRFGYWVAVWSYPIFAVLLVNNVVDFPSAFAAMGTLAGASPFLMFLWKWTRGRF